MKHLWRSMKHHEGDIYGVSRNAAISYYASSKQSRNLPNASPKSNFTAHLNCREAQLESPVLENTAAVNDTTCVDTVEQPDEVKSFLTGLAIISDTESTNSNASIEQKIVKSKKVSHQMGGSVAEGFNKGPSLTSPESSRIDSLLNKSPISKMLKKTIINAQESSTNISNSISKNSGVIDQDLLADHKKSQRKQVENAVSEHSLENQKPSNVEEDYSVKADFEIMRKQLEIFVKDKQEHVEEIECLKRLAKEQEAKLKATNKTHAKLLGDKEKEFEKQVEMLEIKEKQYATLEQKNTALQTELLDTQSKREYFIEENKQIKQKIKHFEKEMNQLREMNKILTAKNNILTEENNKINLLLLNSQSDLAQLNQIVEQKTINMTKYQDFAKKNLQEKEALQEKNKCLSKDVDELKQEAATLASSLQTKKNEQAYIILEYQKLVNLLEKSQTKEDQVNEKLSRSHSNNHKLQRSYKELKLVNRKLKKALKSNQQDIDKFTIMCANSNHKNKAGRKDSTVDCIKNE